MMVETTLVYSLVSVTLRPANSIHEADLVMGGDVAAIEDSINCVGSMNYEAEYCGWKEVLEGCGITGQRIDEWYASGKKDDLVCVYVSMILACYYRHTHSTPSAPEEWDTDYDFVGIVNANKILEDAVAKMKAK